MGIRELLNVTAVALAASAVILAVAWPNLADAVGNGSSQLRPLIPAPGGKTSAAGETTLEALGCRFTLAADKAEHHSDGSPVLALRATNLTDRPVEARLRLQILASRRPSPMARILPLPETVWSQDCTVFLQPSEMKSLKIVANAQVAADTVVTYAMSAGELAARGSQ